MEILNPPLRGLRCSTTYGAGNVSRRTDKAPQYLYFSHATIEMEIPMHEYLFEVNWSQCNDVAICLAVDVLNEENRSTTPSTWFITCHTFEPSWFQLNISIHHCHHSPINTPPWDLGCELPPLPQVQHLGYSFLGAPPAEGQNSATRQYTTKGVHSRFNAERHLSDAPPEPDSENGSSAWPFHRCRTFPLCRLVTASDNASIILPDDFGEQHRPPSLFLNPDVYRHKYQATDFIGH